MGLECSLPEDVPAHPDPLLLGLQLLPAEEEGL